MKFNIIVIYIKCIRIWRVVGYAVVQTLIIKPPIQNTSAYASTATFGTDINTAALTVKWHSIIN